MRIQKKTINNVELEILEVMILDNDDIHDIQNLYSGFHHIQIDLGALQYLKLFDYINTLIITGGIATAEGMNELYNQKSIVSLVLDYEETDSDEDGIILNCFPKLQYVLSRSNLNIKNYSENQNVDYQIEVLNYYYKGKKKNVEFESGYNLFQDKKFLFFSTESQSPAGVLIMQILLPVEKAFHRNTFEVSFSNKIDSIGIIPICMSKDMIEKGAGKERKLVSLKRRMADIRLQIPYEEFLSVDSAGRRAFCRDIIINAAKYIAQKDKSFNLECFISEIDHAMISSRE